MLTFKSKINMPGKFLSLIYSVAIFPFVLFIIMKKNPIIQKGDLKRPPLLNIFVLFFIFASGAKTIKLSSVEKHFHIIFLLYTPF